MPFDLRHLRNPITYHCPVDLNYDARKETRHQQAKELEFAIRLGLDDPELSRRLNPEGPPPFAFRANQPDHSPHQAQPPRTAGAAEGTR